MTHRRFNLNYYKQLIFRQSRKVIGKKKERNILKQKKWKFILIENEKEEK